MQAVRGQVCLAMLMASASTLCGLLALGCLAWLVQLLVEAPDRWPMRPLLAAAACTAAAYGLRLAAFDQSHHAAFRLEKILRTQLSQHLAQVSLGELDRMGAGALAKVMQDDVKALHIFVADSTPMYARAYVAPLASFAMLMWIAWPMALAAASVLVGGVAVMGLAMRGHTGLMQQYNAAREQVGSAVIEFVQAMPVVRSFDGGQGSFGRYQRALDAYREVLTRWYRQAGFSARFSMAILNPLPTIMVLLWLGAWLTWRDALAFADWVAALMIGAGMAESMMPLMSLKHLVNKTGMSIARIDEVMAIPIMPVPAAGHGQQAVNAEVRFDGVSFSYGVNDCSPGTGPSQSTALSKVSFCVPPGSVTALVGPSGAGKSTVARLIPRFWDVTAGRILIGGVDVRDMDSDSLMRQVALVFQDSFLFAGSIADNIRLGLPQASNEQVQAAARAAQAHDFILALPQGYDTQAGERGVFLSGGQRQRIAIARALLQDRPILLLDEATAFADPENEAALIQALAALMRGRTVIMIAHRLSTIRDADQILVFDQGRLNDSGQHEDLLARDGVYARLWTQHERAQSWAMGREGSAGTALSHPDAGRLRNAIPASLPVITEGS